MSHSRKARITAALIELLVLGFPCLPLMAREAKLTLHPQKTPAEVGKFSLLAPQGSLIEGDAVPLYEEAAKALPDKAGDEQVRKLLEMPIGQLPLEEVEQVIAKHMDSLKAVARAVRCRQCDWPDWKPGMQMANLTEYRRIAFVIRLWARLEIADERYDGAIVALQTGLGMARHLGQAPTIVQVLSATAMGHSMCQQVEEFVQGRGAPNLCLALANLPMPFVSMEKAIETERKVAGSQIALEGLAGPAQDRCRVVVKSLDINLAALQCVEAIRAYAATHGGQLPEALTDITETPPSKDPVDGEPLRYVRTGSTATVESSIPPGGNEKHGTRYQITIRK